MEWMDKKKKMIDGNLNGKYIFDRASYLSSNTQTAGAGITLPGEKSVRM